MRPIDTIIIHCSATKPSMDIGAEEIDDWHRARGWAQIGYHYVIRRDGAIEHGRPVEVMGAHVKGHNTGSIGVCYIGGIDEAGKPEDNRTARQKTWMIALVKDLMRVHGVLVERVIGHRETGAPKACPSFDVEELRSELEGYQSDDKSTKRAARIITVYTDGSIDVEDLD